jgi:hypothetical protein
LAIVITAYTRHRALARERDENVEMQRTQRVDGARATKHNIFFYIYNVCAREGKRKKFTISHLHCSTDELKMNQPQAAAVDVREDFRGQTQEGKRGDI